MKMIMRNKPLNIAARQQGVYYRLGHSQIDVPSDDFHVFFNNFIRDAKRIITTQESLPHIVIATSRGYGHDKTVSVEDDMLHCSLVSSPLMQMAEIIYLGLV